MESPRSGSWLVPLALLPALLLAPPRTAPAATGDVTRVSVGAGGVEADGPSGVSAISGDGRFVVFVSRATNLVAGDTNGNGDAFVHDRRTGQTTRISVDNAGNQVSDASVGGAAINADGRIVAFTSSSTQFFPGDTPVTSDVFVRDQVLGTTARVSVASLSTDPSDGDSTSPSLSADGRFVVFASAATNLVANDSNGRFDVFVRDRDSSSTQRISVDSAGNEAVGGMSFSLGGAVSAHGRFVAFSSGATNLVAGDTNGQDDVFVRDRDTDLDGVFDEAGAVATTRVSVSSAGVQGDAGSGSAAISADGRFVVFGSAATNLVAGDTNGVVDVFVHDRQTATTTRVSVASDGAEGNGDVPGFADVSADGRYVVFASDATNLDPQPDTNGMTDVFVHDRLARTTRRISVDAAGNEANGASGFLGILAQATISDVYGRFVAFGSLATNLVTGDTNGVVDVFVKELDSDRDGDGLLDSWETSGFDADGDGTIDIDLPAMGADPLHKDLFLELDTMTGQLPRRAGILLMKEAFAAAPVDAGGVRNPDDQPGITLHVDTGPVSDPTAVEGIGGLGSCGNMADDDGDGRIDGADEDCLLSENLGGGNALTPTTVCGLDAAYYGLRATNFDPRRRSIFRYAISGQGCDANSDGQIDIGGEGEIGGNDFVDFNHDGGTLMHEFGHNLGLRHGGFENANCKPSYVSIMNYDSSFGIEQVGGPDILDYSPPRFPGGRGVVPSVVLEEDALSESTVLDATDGTNLFVFTDASGSKSPAVPMDAMVDWNRNGTIGDTIPPTNIDTCANAMSGTMTICVPRACANSSTTFEIKSYDDWSNISLGFVQFGDAHDGPINPTTIPEPTLAELLLIKSARNTASLNVTRARVWRSRVPGQADGMVSVRGDFVADALARPDSTAGITLRVYGNGLDETHTWAASECTTASDGTIRCAAAGPTILRLRPFRVAPDVYILDARVRRLTIAPPVQGPLTVEITYGPRTRTGTIATCRAAQGAGLLCRTP